MNDPKKYLSILGVLAIVCFALALMLGATFKSPAAVLQGLLTHDFDIWQYRIPRAILAVMVGAALALSGTIIQGIIHNPPASPDILSINHGASLAAVAMLMMMPGTPVWALPVAACVGAAVAYLVLMLVAGRQAGPLQMALIGVALSAFYAAITDYLTSSLSVPRPLRRSARTSNEGGRMKMLLASGRDLRTCAAPCTSISKITS